MYQIKLLKMFFSQICAENADIYCLSLQISGISEKFCLVIS